MIRRPFGRRHGRSAVSTFFVEIRLRVNRFMALTTKPYLTVGKLGHEGSLHQARFLDHCREGLSRLGHIRTRRFVQVSSYCRRRSYPARHDAELFELTSPRIPRDWVFKVYPSKEWEMAPYCQDLAALLRYNGSYIVSYCISTTYKPMWLSG